MSMRRGRCNNIELCENAARQRTIEVADNEPFVCPKCGSELVSVSDRKSTRSAASLALPLVVISLAVAGVGYKVWDMYGRPAAAPSTATMAPAKPPADAAVAPAPVPVPAPVPAPPAAVPDSPAAAAPGATAVAPAPIPAPAPAPPQKATAAAPDTMAPAQPAANPPAPPPPVAPAVQAPAEPAPTLAPEAAPPSAPAASPAPASADADSAQRVQAFLGSATRVPITFTFRSSVVALTGRSEHDVDKLVSYLKARHATGDRVYLAGFTDNQGDPASNEAVSQKRVAAVAAALTQAGITPEHVASFGSAMPVADNSTQAGRDRNRRVEVYLAP